MSSLSEELNNFLNQNLPSVEQFSSLIQTYKTELGIVIIQDYEILLNQYEQHLLFEKIYENNSHNNYLLDYVWEKLHSGYWKNVHISWRKLYSVLKLLDVLCQIQSIDFNLNSTHQTKCILVKLIHDLDYSLIMGYPIFDHFASKLASKLHKILTDFDDTTNRDIYFSGDKNTCNLNMNQNLFIRCMNEINLEKCNKSNLNELNLVELPSMEKFHELMIIGEPFIITNAINFWPAYQFNHRNHWNLNNWKQNYGFRLVPIEIGSRYTDETWGQELMTIEKFIDNYILKYENSQDNKQSKGYLAQHQLFLQIPELINDVYIPDYCMLNGLVENDYTDVDMNIWFGPKGTISPLHHDSDRANLLSQINGSKYVILYCASETKSLYPFEEKLLKNTSQIDVENPDYESYPEFSKAHGFHGILEAGQMLYIPPRCWHYLRSLSASFSVNFWWDVMPKFIPSWPE